jgi:hypothetical protein
VILSDRPDLQVATERREHGTANTSSVTQGHAQTGQEAEERSSEEDSEQEPLTSCEPAVG